MVARVSIIAEYRVERISKYIYFVVISMLLVGIFLFVVAPFIQQLLGNDYAGTDQLFKIMTFVPLFVGIVGVWG